MKDMSISGNIEYLNYIMNVNVTGIYENTVIVDSNLFEDVRDYYKLFIIFRW